MEAPSKFKIDQDLKLIFVGQTGSGKSTSINMVVNLISGLGFNDRRKIAVPQTQKFVVEREGETFERSIAQECNVTEFRENSSENTEAGDAKSKTTWPGLYVLKDRASGHKITIVDTPGLEDTSGETADNANVDAIINAIFYLNGVHAICLVHNATSSRLTPSLELALKKIKHMFTENCMANIVLYLTNYTKGNSPNCMDAINKAGFPTKNIFRFQNNCLVHPDNYKAFSIEKFDNVTSDVEEIIEINSNIWDDNRKTFEKMIGHIKKLPLVDVETMKKVYLQKASLRPIIGDLCRRTEKIEDLIYRINIESTNSKAYKGEIEKNKNFKETKIIKKEERWLMNPIKNTGRAVLNVFKFAYNIIPAVYAPVAYFGEGTVHSVIRLNTVIEENIENWHNKDKWNEEEREEMRKKQIDSKLEYERKMNGLGNFFMDQFYGFESLDVKEYDIETEEIIDQIKKLNFDKSKEGLEKTARAKKLLEERKSYYEKETIENKKMICYLIKQIEEEQPGKTFDPILIQEEMKNDLEILRKRKVPVTKLNMDPSNSEEDDLTDQMVFEQAIKQMEKIGDIIQEAKQFSVSNSQDRLEIKLKPFKELAQKKQEIQLNYIRESFERVCPYIIN